MMWLVSCNTSVLFRHFCRHTGDREVVGTLTHESFPPTAVSLAYTVGCKHFHRGSWRYRKTPPATRQPNTAPPTAGFSGTLLLRVQELRKKFRRLAPNLPHVAIFKQEVNRWSCEKSVDLAPSSGFERNSAANNVRFLEFSILIGQNFLRQQL